MIRRDTEENMEKKQTGYIYWINGLRGIACIMIFLHHFLVGFFPATYYGVGVVSHGNGAWDVFLSQSPLGVFINGNFWVCVFCVLSALVQSYKIYHSEDLGELPYDMAKRYFRLALPVFCVSCIVYLMLKLETFGNIQAGAVTQSPWIMSYYQVKASVKDVFLSAFVNVWTQGDTTFSNAFWMLQYILWGSYLTYMLALVTRNRRPRILVLYLGLIVLFINRNVYMTAFVAGCFVAYEMTYYSGRFWDSLWLGVTELVAGLFMGGYPTGVAPSNIYRYLTWMPYERWHILGALFFVLGIIHLKPMRQLLETRVSLFFGKISFAVYLVHIPVVFSLGTYAFLWSYGATGRYQISAGLAGVVSVCAILVLAALFRRFVEPLCGRIISRGMKLVMAPMAVPIENDPRENG